MESSESLVEDACWLQSECEDKHINLAELDTILKGINMALQWRVTVVHLKTDSTWVSDVLSGKSQVCMNAATEMLIRRRLSTIKELVKEYKLTVDMELVRSHANQDDQPTRVPQSWLGAVWKEMEPVCTASMEEQESTHIQAIHQLCMMNPP